MRSIRSLSSSASLNGWPAPISCFLSRLASLFLSYASWASLILERSESNSAISRPVNDLNVSGLFENLLYKDEGSMVQERRAREKPHGVKKPGQSGKDGITPMVYWKLSE